MREVRRGKRIGSIDCDSLVAVLSEHPVRLAILFGSHASGTTTSSSDIDLAVEFEQSVSDEKYHDVYFALMADLMSTLEENSIDLTDITDMQPAVGASALEDGVVLRGTVARAKQHQRAFERAASEAPERTRRERFDDLLSRMEGLV